MMLYNLYVSLSEQLARQSFGINKLMVYLTRKIKQLTKLTILPFLLLSMTACSHLALFDTKGPVGDSIASTMIYTVLLMLIVVIPTVFLSIYIPYKFRASNTKEEFKPEWSHSRLIESVVWGIPIVIILFLAVETYKKCFELDPARELVASPTERPLKIQVVALDWKWLFIYPEQGIATINEIAIPIDKPVQFLLTSDGAINSFFIPRLGSQLYAMNGVENKLNLMASEAGVFKGISANYSGFGFSGMRFKVHAQDKAGYDKWVAKVKSSPKVLDDVTYNKLTEKSRDNKVEYFSNPQPLRFKNIIERNNGANIPKASIKHKHSKVEDKKHD